MASLLIATTNPGKLAELSRFLSDLPLRLLSLKDVGITSRVEETGSSFQENAILKATHYCKLSGLPTLADDGGFEIDALGGEPGIKSHRWIRDDRESSDEELVAYALKNLKNVPAGKRGAQLRVVLALALPDGSTHTAEASIRGIIPRKPLGYITPGYPYRSLLFLPKLGKYYNYHELTPAETEQLNHRKIALDKLRPYLYNLK